MLSTVKDSYAALFGRRYLREADKREKAAVGNLLDAIATMEERFTFEQFHAKDESPSPIFIFSAGWRSGSTFLQRLICSNNDTLIWGEPFGDTGLLHHLIEPLTRITKTRPPDSFFIQNNLEIDDLKNTWIANLYPTVDDLRCAYRDMLDRLFAIRAKQAGVSRWGLKEVRVDAAQAALFRWLYPKSKLVFLVRNPVDAYRSYSADKTWYAIRPKQPIHTAKQFADHWNRLASSFIQHASALGGILVRYEDLTSDSKATEELQQYLNIGIDPNAFERVIGGSAGQAKSRNKLLIGEQRIIQYITVDSRPHFDYL